MKRFLKNIAIFSCMIVILLITGEIIVRNLPSSYTTKDIELRKRGSEINTLILGTSHTYYGIKSDFLGDSVFNLANVSQTPEYDLALLQNYYTSLPNLKYLIIPVSYFTYRDPKMEDDPEGNLAMKYKTRMKLPLHSDFSIYNLEMADFTSFTGQLSNIVLKKPSNKSDSLGFGIGYTEQSRPSDWADKGEERAEKHTLQNEGRFQDVLNVQRQILKLAEKEGWKVILITTPTYKTYYENLDSTQEAEMRGGIKILKEEFNVDYYDFLMDPRFKTQDFYDVDHLSERGAKKFARILADSIYPKTSI